MATATPPSPTAAAGGPRRPRRSIRMFLLRLLFKGKRAFVTLPFLLLLALAGWEMATYWYYRGVSTGTRTGVIVKVSYKGTPFCRYESVEMRVGQTPTMAVMNAETWEFTVDPEARWLIPRVEEAERKQEPITVKYRQDSRARDAQPPPPNNLPWRFCVTTSYHAVDIVKQ